MAGLMYVIIRRAQKVIEIYNAGFRGAVAARRVVSTIRVVYTINRVRDTVILYNVLVE